MTQVPTLYGKGPQPREAARRPQQPLYGGVLCLDFLNTTDTHAGNPRNDALAPGYVNVIEWFTHAGAIGETDTTRLLRAAQKEPRDAAAVRKRAITLRGSLFDITMAFISKVPPPEEAMATFNREHSHALASGEYVARDSGLAWQWNRGTHLDFILWPVCQSAADLLSSARIARVRQCASPSCQRLFLDTSKNGSRRFCSSSGCGAVERVRRFRERQRAES